jgi:hypothetical protein
MTRPGVRGDENAARLFASVALAVPPARASDREAGGCRRIKAGVRGGENAARLFASVALAVPPARASDREAGGRRRIKL